MSSASYDRRIEDDSVSRLDAVLVPPEPEWKTSALNDVAIEALDCTFASAFPTPGQAHSAQRCRQAWMNCHVYFSRRYNDNLGQSAEIRAAIEDDASTILCDLEVRLSSALDARLPKGPVAPANVDSVVNVLSAAVWVKEKVLRTAFAPLFSHPLQSHIHLRTALEKRLAERFIDDRIVPLVLAWLGEPRDSTAVANGAHALVVLIQFCGKESGRLLEALSVRIRGFITTNYTDIGATLWAVTQNRRVFDFLEGLTKGGATTSAGLGAGAASTPPPPPRPAFISESVWAAAVNSPSFYESARCVVEAECTYLSHLLPSSMYNVLVRRLRAAVLGTAYGALDDATEGVERWTLQREGRAARAVAIATERRIASGGASGAGEARGCRVRECVASAVSEMLQSEGWKAWRGGGVAVSCTPLPPDSSTDAATAHCSVTSRSSSFETWVEVLGWVQATPPSHFEAAMHATVEGVAVAVGSSFPSADAPAASLSQWAISTAKAVEGLLKGTEKAGSAVRSVVEQGITVAFDTYTVSVVGKGKGGMGGGKAAGVSGGVGKGGGKCFTASGAAMVAAVFDEVLSACGVAAADASQGSGVGAPKGIVGRGGVGAASLRARPPTARPGSSSGNGGGASAPSALASTLPSIVAAVSLVPLLSCPHSFVAAYKSDLADRALQGRVLSAPDERAVAAELAEKVPTAVGASLTHAVALLESAVSSGDAVNDYVAFVKRAPPRSFEVARRCATVAGVSQYVQAQRVHQLVGFVDGTEVDRETEADGDGGTGCGEGVEGGGGAPDSPSGRSGRGGRTADRDRCDGDSVPHVQDGSAPIGTVVGAPPQPPGCASRQPWAATSGEVMCPRTRAADASADAAITVEAARLRASCLCVNLSQFVRESDGCDVVLPSSVGRALRAVHLLAIERALLAGVHSRATIMRRVGRVEPTLGSMRVQIAFPLRPPGPPTTIVTSGLVQGLILHALSSDAEMLSRGCTVTQLIGKITPSVSPLTPSPLPPAAVVGALRVLLRPLSGTAAGPAAPPSSSSAPPSSSGPPIGSRLVLIFDSGTKLGVSVDYHRLSKPLKRLPHAPHQPIAADDVVVLNSAFAPLRPLYTLPAPAIARECRAVTTATPAGTAEGGGGRSEGASDGGGSGAGRTVVECMPPSTSASDAAGAVRAAVARVAKRIKTFSVATLVVEVCGALPPSIAAEVKVTSEALVGVVDELVVKGVLARSPTAPSEFTYLNA